jgi:hypothetical protein
LLIFPPRIEDIFIFLQISKRTSPLAPVEEPDFGDFEREISVSHCTSIDNACGKKVSNNA